jgi:hypothetical protein
MTSPERIIAVGPDEELIEQRKAYLRQIDVVARELCRLTSVSDRALASLTDTEADAQLLETVRQKSNDLLALQRQLRELWTPYSNGAACRDAQVIENLRVGR